MSKPIPPISKYMTTAPHTIGADQTVATSARLMHEHHIRHLPVLSGGRVVGMITERDIALVETLKDVDPKVVTVEDAMSQPAYTCDASAPLSEVCGDMAEKKLGAAIVTQNGHVVGVFTTVDVCRVVAELLETRLRS